VTRGKGGKSRVAFSQTGRIRKSRLPSSAHASFWVWGRRIVWYGKAVSGGRTVKRRQSVAHHVIKVIACLGPLATCFIAITTSMPVASRRRHVIHTIRLFRTHHGPSSLLVDSSHVALILSGAATTASTFPCSWSVMPAYSVEGLMRLSVVEVATESL
jgi:hypothetical protein